MRARWERKGGGGGVEWGHLMDYLLIASTLYSESGGEEMLATLRLVPKGWLNSP